MPAAQLKSSRAAELGSHGKLHAPAHHLTCAWSGALTHLLAPCICVDCPASGLQGRAFSAGGDFSFIEERMAASVQDNQQASSRRPLKQHTAAGCTVSWSPVAAAAAALCSGCSSACCGSVQPHGAPHQQCCCYFTVDAAHLGIKPERHVACNPSPHLALALLCCHARLPQPRCWAASTAPSWRCAACPW